MPGCRIAAKAVRIDVTTQVRQAAKLRPNGRGVLGNAAAVLAEKDLRAASAEPQRLARGGTRRFVDGGRGNFQTHCLALSAVTELGAEATRRGGVMATVQRIRPRKNSQRAQRLRGFSGRGFGFQHGGDVALAGQRQHNIDLVTGPGGA